MDRVDNPGRVDRVDPDLIPWAAMTWVGQTLQDRRLRLRPGINRRAIDPGPGHFTPMLSVVLAGFSRSLGMS